MIKVVLHCQSGISHYTGEGGVKYDIEKKFGEEIDYHPFSGFLSGFNLDRFVDECQDADIVITDAWTHPVESDNYTVQDGYNYMLEALIRVRDVNPEAFLFAQLMEGVHRVPAHDIAHPHTHYSDDSIISAMEQIRVLKGSSVYEDMPLIMVVDDSSVHLRAAREQFVGCRLITSTSYLEAIRILDKHKVDVVLTDLMMPNDQENQGTKGIQFVGQEAPMGVFVAAKALEMGVDTILVVSDTGHHDHPAGHVAEILSSAGPIKWFCGNKCRMTKGDSYESGKDWKGMYLESH